MLGNRVAAVILTFRVRDQFRVERLFFGRGVRLYVVIEFLPRLASGFRVAISYVRLE